MKIQIVLFEVLLLLFACSNRKADDKTIEYAFMIHNQYTGDSMNKIPVFTTKDEYWKSGNNIIETVAKIVVHEDDTSTQTKIVVDKFVFFNFDKKIVREYGSLSDTATIKKEFSFSDTTVRRPWRDFTKNFNIKYDSKIRLADTMVNNILYKRERCVMRLGVNDLVFDAFFNCNNPRSDFEFSKNLSDEMGCPHIKTVTYYLGNLRNIFYESELFFGEVTSKDKMEKIFKAWSK
nr:hypothetical protein [uncultured Sediminibacterium sp.]